MKVNKYLLVCIETSLYETIHSFKMLHIEPPSDDPHQHKFYVGGLEFAVDYIRKCTNKHESYDKVEIENFVKRMVHSQSFTSDEYCGRNNISEQYKAAKERNDLDWNVYNFKLIKVGAVESPLILDNIVRKKILALVMSHNTKDRINKVSNIKYESAYFSTDKGYFKVTVDGVSELTDEKEIDEHFKLIANYKLLSYRSFFNLNYFVHLNEGALYVYPNCYYKFRDDHKYGKTHFLLMNPEFGSGNPNYSVLMVNKFHDLDNFECYALKPVGEENCLRMVPKKDFSALMELV